MTTSIISLGTNMNRRLLFRHSLMDQVDEYKLKEDEVMSIIKATIAGDDKSRQRLILGHMWLAKDVVCRFRAHFAETRRMTDDMASEALEALTEFVNELKQPANFFNRAQARIHNRVRSYINDNRAICSASRSTNARRQQKDQPLEYYFAEHFSEEFHGEEDFNPGFVDILDAVERLREADKEQMHTLITMFLSQNHNIDESDLTEDEREVIEYLSGLGGKL